MRELPNPHAQRQHLTNTISMCASSRHFLHSTASDIISPLKGRSSKIPLFGVDHRLLLSSFEQDSIFRPQHHLAGQPRLWKLSLCLVSTWISSFSNPNEISNKLGHHEGNHLPQDCLTRTHKILPEFSSLREDFKDVCLTTVSFLLTCNSFTSDHCFQDFLFWNIYCYSFTFDFKIFLSHKLSDCAPSE